jgi:hypothetical protein
MELNPASPLKLRGSEEGQEGDDSSRDVSRSTKVMGLFQKALTIEKSC